MNAEGLFVLCFFSDAIYTRLSNSFKGIHKKTARREGITKWFEIAGFFLYVFFSKKKKKSEQESYM